MRTTRSPSGALLRRMKKTGLLAAQASLYFGLVFMQRSFWPLFCDVWRCSHCLIWDQRQMLDMGHAGFLECSASNFVTTLLVRESSDVVTGIVVETLVVYMDNTCRISPSEIRRHCRPCTFTHAYTHTYLVAYLHTCTHAYLCTYIHDTQSARQEGGQSVNQSSQPTYTLSHTHTHTDTNRQHTCTFSSKQCPCRL